MSLLDADSIISGDDQNSSELDQEVVVEKMSFENGHMDLLLQHPVFAIFSDELARYFFETGAQNYQELTFQHEEFGKFTLTIQKQNGHTPGYINHILREALEHILKMQVEAAHDIAQEALEEVGYLDA